MKAVSADIIKARIIELQSDVDRVKSDLESLKESARLSFTSADVQKMHDLTRELLTYKAGQAELINLLQD